MLFPFVKTIPLQLMQVLVMTAIYGQLERQLQNKSNNPGNYSVTVTNNYSTISCSSTKIFEVQNQILP
jgi:hypothetical protein